MCSNCFTVWDVKLWTHNRVFSNNSECSWHVCLSCMAYAFAVFKMFFLFFFSKHALKNNSFHLLFSVVLLHLLQSERWRFWTRSFSDWLRLKKKFPFQLSPFQTEGKELEKSTYSSHVSDVNLSRQFLCPHLQKQPEQQLLFHCPFLLTSTLLVFFFYFWLLGKLWLHCWVLTAIM